MSTSTRSWGCSDWSILALTCRGQMLNEPLSESRDAGNPPVRFDERDLETGLRATAPDLDSTFRRRVPPPVRSPKTAWKLAENGNQGSTAPTPSVGGRIRKSAAEGANQIIQAGSRRDEFILLTTEPGRLTLCILPGLL